jgi:hypothetical protein
VFFARVGGDVAEVAEAWAYLPLMHTVWCRIYLKKNLISAQNPENKGLEFFLPPRSMVLKVS